MPRRTVKAARQTLEGMAPGLNPEMWRRLSEEVEAVAKDAVAMANRYADDRTQAAHLIGKDVLTEMCAVRDGLVALVREGEAGTISAAEYHKRLSDLRRQQSRLEGKATEVARAAEQVETIEEDPEAWTDTTFYERFPSLQPDVSF